MLFHLSGRLPSGGGFKRAEKERTRDVGEELFYIPPDAVLCYVKNNVDFGITINEYRHNAITNNFVDLKHVAAVLSRVPSSGTRTWNVSSPRVLLVLVRRKYMQNPFSDTPLPSVVNRIFLAEK